MAPSQVAPYFLGVVCLALGIHAYVNPRGEYPRFGLKLESASASGSHSKQGSSRGTRGEGHVSPLMYLKASREISYGLGFIAFGYQGNDDAITTLIGICSLAGLTDAIVVWRHGGLERRNKVWGHALAFVGLAWWSMWRVCNS